MSARVVGAGWHDVCLRWDISTPQAVVARLDALPGQGSISQPGRKLFAERDRFGGWRHLLGPSQVLVAFVVDSPDYGVIRRLELQGHFGDDGEDDLCSPGEFPDRWKRTQAFMAMAGVLPPEDPVCTRVDSAVDVVYEDPLDGRQVLEALRYARWPYGWYAEYAGPPPFTTVAIKKGTRIVARAYCRNTKLRNGRPRWGKVRFEREQRFAWKEQRPVAELELDVVAETIWSSAFGSERAVGKVTRIEREVQTLKLIERVQLGDMTVREFEQLTGYLDAERMGVADRVYNAETARRRRALARGLGASVADAELEPLDVSLDELLAVPRSAWGSWAGDAAAAPTP